jgi:type I restriction enzyme R subunit
MKFTEAKLEEAFIELLANEDFPHFVGNSITRTEDEVLIEADLKSYLLDRYRRKNLTEID